MHCIMYYIFLGIPRPLRYRRREGIRGGGGGKEEKAKRQTELSVRGNVITLITDLDPTVYLKSNL